RSRRVGSGFGRSLDRSWPFRGRPCLFCGGTLADGGGGPSFLSFSTGFSRASISVASRAIAPMMRPPSARLISAACILSGRSPCANSVKARENVASEGTCARRSQPQTRRSDLSAPRRSMRALVVGMPSTALATKARARPRRSSGGRPAPLGASGTKASRPITENGDEPPEQFGHRLDFLTHPRKQGALDMIPTRPHGVERIGHGFCRGACCLIRNHNKIILKRNSNILNTLLATIEFRSIYIAHLKPVPPIILQEAPLSSDSVLVSINGTIGNVAFYNNEKIILGKSACYFNLTKLTYKIFVKAVLDSPYFANYALQGATGT